jgi:hypothetical protein
VFGESVISLFNSMPTGIDFGPAVGRGVHPGFKLPPSAVWAGPGHGTPIAAERPARSITRKFRRSLIIRLMRKYIKRHKFLKRFGVGFVFPNSLTRLKQGSISSAFAP